MYPLDSALHVAVLALAMSAVNFLWLLYKHVFETRIRIGWVITSGDSIDHPNGFVSIILINHSRAAIRMDEPSLAFKGPSLDEMSDEEFKIRCKVQRAEFKKRGIKLGPAPKLSPFHGRGELVEIPPHDSRTFVLPSESKFRQSYPPYRSGVEIRLRNGRSRLITWDEIWKPVPRFVQLDPRRQLAWIFREL